jgi:hypothetical protein
VSSDNRSAASRHKKMKSDVAEYNIVQMSEEDMILFERFKKK